MSEVPIGERPDAEAAFNPRTMMIVAGVGVLAFVAMLVLGAYAPDLRSGRNGGAHALSNAATGFSGLVRLAEATDRYPRIVRSEPYLKSEDLTVITPDHGWIDLAKILALRGPRATLLVLPKWETIPDRQRSGWVRVTGLLDPGDPERILYPSTPVKVARARSHREPLVGVGLAATADIHFLAPPVVQSITGKTLEPMITTRDGRILLGRVGGQSLYLLSDPDLINNHGMGDERQAKAALALLDFLNSTGAESVQFDVTTNGLGHSRSPLKLAFDPPFLAVTLIIFAAGLLAGWQALLRFGPVGRRERAIAFGKAALVDNSAALIRKARRESHLGNRYVDVIRDRAVALFRLPTTLDAQTLDARLEELNPRRSFAATAAAAADARRRDELLGAAQSLNQWIEEVQQ